MVKWQLSVSSSVHGIVTDKSWKKDLVLSLSWIIGKNTLLWIIGKKHFIRPQHLNISIDKLNGQVRLLDEAVDCADVESNIAQGYCPVHRELEMSGIK